MKTVITTASLLVLLCGPALAETSYSVGITLTTNPQQKYELLVVDNTCADMQVKAPKHEAFFRVCAKPADQGKVRIELERKTRDGDDEISNHATVTTTPKGSFSLLDMKVSLQ